MKSTLTNHAAAVFVGMVLVVSLGYSVYTSVFSTTAENQQQTEQALVQACQKALARSIIFQNFANEAASARRAQAIHDANSGDQVSAQNNLATAKRYEGFADKYDALTTKDCAKFYNQS